MRVLLPVQMWILVDQSTSQSVNSWLPALGCTGKRIQEGSSCCWGAFLTATINGR